MSSKLITKLATPLLSLYEKVEAERVVQLILEDVFKYKKHQIPDELTATQATEWDAIAQRLQRGEPMQHITERADFYGYIFYVDKNVLIPRPETEELVEWILDTNSKNTQRNCLDIGTGSGCIPIAIQKKRTDWRVSACDISAEAIAIAQKNANINNCNIHFIQLDILNKMNYANYNLPKYDIIVSNPPYILASEAQEMHTNVRDYEPHLALFVPDREPLVFYQAIIDFAAIYLQAKGQLFFEIHYQKGDEMLVLMQKSGIFSEFELRKDIFGNDRMVRGIKK